jgi:hypothetical protein
VRQAELANLSACQEVHLHGPPQQPSRLRGRSTIDLTTASAVHQSEPELHRSPPGHMRSCCGAHSGTCLPDSGVVPRRLPPPGGREPRTAIRPRRRVRTPSTPPVAPLASRRALIRHS